MTENRRLQSTSYTVGWVAAFPFEFIAAREMLDERHGRPLDLSENPADDNIYCWGKIGDHNVVFACNGLYDKYGATTTAFGMITSLPHLRFCLMVGIGAGLPRVTDDGKVSSDSDIRLGDVVVGVPQGTNPGVVQYDLEKLKRYGQREQVGSLNRPPQVLLRGIASLQALDGLDNGPDISKVLDGMLEKYRYAFKHLGPEKDFLFPTSYQHRAHSIKHSRKPETCDSCDKDQAIQRHERGDLCPQVHYGTIASGDKLVKDGIEREELLDGLEGGCLCFEMEAAGLMSHLPCLVIRGICDYADTHKNDVWQPYAATTAAAFARILLNNLPGVDVANEPSFIGQIFGEDDVEVRGADLRKIGFSHEDIENLLEQERVDAPWIFFEPSEIPSKTSPVIREKHIPYCHHQDSAVTLSAQVEDRGSSMDIDHSHGISQEQSPEGARQTTSLESCLDVSLQKRTVQALCGLGGISPTRSEKSRNVGTFHDVTFKDDTRVAVLAYPREDAFLTLSYIRQVLERFCGAAGNFQNMGLCCDSFTFLRKGSVGSSAIQLCRLDFGIPLELLGCLNNIRSLEDIEKETKLPALAWRLLMTIIGEETGEQSQTNLHETLDIIQACALATQFLCLAFVSYTQAHVGALQLPFLESLLHRVDLQGCQPFHQALTKIEPTFNVSAVLMPLTCIQCMLHEPVLVFTIQEKHSIKLEKTAVHSPAPSDLIGCPEDILDTWGPGFYISAGRAISPELLLGIRVGEGIIAAVENDEYHWFPTAVLELRTGAGFSRNTQLRIGAITANNGRCHFNEEVRFGASDGLLHHIGTRNARWELAQLQGVFTAGSDYCGAQIGQIYNKIPGQTLKQQLLSEPMGFLEDFWGLSISYCTGIAQRVTLRELIADLMEPFAGSCLDPPAWDYLQQGGLAPAFQNRASNLHAWLSLQPREYRLTVRGFVQVLLEALKETGVNQHNMLNIIWIQPRTRLRCFRIPCRDSSFWAKMLIDSPDCATFAYITSRCVTATATSVTASTRCRNPQISWSQRTPMFETAVSLYLVPGVASASEDTRWNLEENNNYLFGQPSPSLLAQIERNGVPGKPTLIVRPISIPEKLWRRILESRALMEISSTTRLRLRERQERRSPAEDVVVVSDTR